MNWTMQNGHSVVNYGAFDVQHSAWIVAFVCRLQGQWIGVLWIVPEARCKNPNQFTYATDFWRCRNTITVECSKRHFWNWSNYKFGVRVRSPNKLSLNSHRAVENLSTKSSFSLSLLTKQVAANPYIFPLLTQIHVSRDVRARHAMAVPEREANDNLISIRHLGFVNIVKKSTHGTMASHSRTFRWLFWQHWLHWLLANNNANKNAGLCFVLLSSAFGDHCF